MDRYRHDRRHLIQFSLEAIRVISMGGEAEGSRIMVIHPWGSRPSQSLEPTPRLGSRWLPTLLPSTSLDSGSGFSSRSCIIRHNISHPSPEGVSFFPSVRASAWRKELFYFISEHSICPVKQQTTWELARVTTLYVCRLRISLDGSLIRK